MKRFFLLICSVMIISFSACQNDDRLRAEYILEHAGDLSMQGRQTAISSLDSAAVFFGKHGPKEKSAQAWLCLGKAYSNADDSRNAILALTKATKSVGSDSAALALIYNEIAKVYRRTGDFAEEISYLEKASEAYDNSGKPYSSRMARFESAVASYRAKDFKTASASLKLVMEDAVATSDTLLEAKCLETYAKIAVDNPEPEPKLAVNLLTRVSNELHTPLSSIDRGILAYAYSLLGNVNDARMWLARAGKSAETEEDIIRYKYRSYQVNAIEGKSKEALKSLEEYVLYTDKLQFERLKKSAVNAEKEYFRQQSELASAKADSFRMEMLVIAALALALIFSVTGFLRYRNLETSKRLEEEKAETEKYMNLAEELQSKMKVSETRKASAEKHSHDAKSEMLERLCEQYYVYEGTENLQPKVLKEVKSIIDDLRTNPKTIADMERNLDESYGGLVSRLRTQLPKLKEDDIRLYVYVASGFSSTAISTILEKEKNIIYNRIYRLKGKIESSEAENKAEFLDFLSK